MFKRFLAVVLLLVLVPAATSAQGSKPYLSLAGIPFGSSRDVVMSQMKANGYQYNYVSPQNLDDEPYSGSIEGDYVYVLQAFNPAGKLVATLVSLRATRVSSDRSYLYGHFIAAITKRYGDPVRTKRSRNYIAAYWSPYDGKLDNMNVPRGGGVYVYPCSPFNAPGHQTPCPSPVPAQLIENPEVLST